MEKEEIDFINSKFKPSFRGIIEASGGWKELLWTKFHLFSGAISFCVIILYFLNISSIKESFDLIKTVGESAISLLGGIVGLSLAGLTLIITFGNPDMIARGSKYQYKQYSEKGDFEASYFQVAIAKFAFIVFYQILVLIVFFLISLFQDMDIEVNPALAFSTNTVVFCLSCHLLIFSLVLVIALIFNLFSFSQNSNFHNFASNVPRSPNPPKDEEKPKPGN
jgi:hypothetical protein